MFPEGIKFVLSLMTMTSRFETLSGYTRKQTNVCHYTSTSLLWFTVSDTVNIIRLAARFKPEHSNTHFHISYTSPSFWKSGMIYRHSPLPPSPSSEPSPDYRPHHPNAAVPSRPAETITLQSLLPPATLSRTLLYSALIFLHFQKMTALQRL